jgi:hypothetical protein
MWHRTAVFALVIVATLPAFSDADAKTRSAADQALYEKAMKDCRSPKRANAAWPQINYSGGWYRCVESKTR